MRTPNSTHIIYKNYAIKSEGKRRDITFFFFLKFSILKPFNPGHLSSSLFYNKSLDKSNNLLKVETNVNAVGHWTSYIYDYENLV